MKRLLILLFLLPWIAHAQNTITLNADMTSGNGEVTPTLTWNTSPPADECTASGAWSGAKGPSGSETLPTITSSTTYNLACTWSGDVTATLSWENPTLNTDGSPYADPGSLLILYDLEGESGDGLDLMEPIANPMVTSRVIEGLQPGTWVFEAYAINSRGISSEPSNRATKVITGSVESTESIGITVNPVPQAITGLQAL